MTPNEFGMLSLGDIVRNKGSGDGYVITWDGGTHYMGMRQVHISNPSEWELMRHTIYDKDPPKPPPKDPAPTWLAWVIGILASYGLLDLVATLLGIGYNGS